MHYGEKWEEQIDLRIDPECCDLLRMPWPTSQKKIYYLHRFQRRLEPNLTIKVQSYTHAVVYFSSFSCGWTALAFAACFFSCVLLCDWRIHGWSDQKASLMISSCKIRICELRITPTREIHSCQNLPVLPDRLRWLTRFWTPPGKRIADSLCNRKTYTQSARIKTDPFRWTAGKLL